MAPMVIPCKKYFCNEKNNINIGMDAITEPAINGPYNVESTNLKEASPTCIVLIVLDSVTSNGQKKSFQWATKLNIP